MSKLPDIKKKKQSINFDRQASPKTLAILGKPAVGFLFEYENQAK